jgi:hypothetical protein
VRVTTFRRGGWKRFANALGARVDLRLSWNGEALDRLLDSAHAQLAESMVAVVRGAGWEVAAEVTFQIRGERGSIDLLAWHAASRLLLVIEIKSVVADIQAMLASLDRKARLARDIGAGRGWSPIAIGCLVVIGETRTSRRRVEALAETFNATLPARAVAVRRWLKSPSADEPLRGLLFLSSAHGMSTRHRASRARSVLVRDPPGRVAQSLSERRSDEHMTLST